MPLNFNSIYNSCIFTVLHIFMKNIYLVLLIFLSIRLFAGNNLIDKTAEAKTWLKNQPLAFIENKGQFTDSEGKPAKDVLFKATSGNMDIYITTKGLSYVFIKQEGKLKEKTGSGFKDAMSGKTANENIKTSCYRMDMNLEGATIGKEQILKELPGKQGYTNYFYPHCPEGIYGVQEYGKITIKNIYKGIDWVIYTNSDSKGQPMKYDFVVQPQADFKDIKMKFVNAQSTLLTDNGTKLKIQTIAGNIEEGGLYSYLKNSSAKQAIKTSYIFNKDSLLQFEIGAYDKTKPLVIDPLVWATYYGAISNDMLYSTCTDRRDNIYVLGTTDSPDFPTLQMSGAFWQTSNKGNTDLIISKFDSEGVRQWATFYGGSDLDDARSITSDKSDNIYITGSTYSPDLPMKNKSGAFNKTSISGTVDVFIFKLTSNSVLEWATYYGGKSADFGTEIKTDSQSNIFITGFTFSSDFPTKELAGAYNQKSTSDNTLDIIILKFDNNGKRIWASCYGGLGSDKAYSLCFDSEDNLYIVGSTSSRDDFPTLQKPGAYWQLWFPSNFFGIDHSFILMFDKNNELKWATFYGGANMDNAWSVACDHEDNIYMVGSSSSNDFPVQELPGAYNQLSIAGAINATIVKFNKQGTCVWATYYGGLGSESASSVCFDAKNNVYITGYTGQNGFPDQKADGEYFQPQDDYGRVAYILKFNDKGTRTWATSYGMFETIGCDIVADNKNSVYITGYASTVGRNYTIDPGYGAYYDDSFNGSYDGFILKIQTCNNRKPTSLQSERNNICSNDNGTLTLIAHGGNGDTLKWYTGGCGINYIGKDTVMIIPSPTKTTTYYARWESLCDTSACDSIVINVYSEIRTAKNPMICQGEAYSVGLSKYTISGLYTDILKTVSGCDSIITTNLTVNPVKQFTLDTIICQGGIVGVGMHIYTTSGTYSDTLQTIPGCDSIITTNLTVNPNQQNILNPAICEGDVFIVGTSIYKTAGIKTDVLKTYLGCDSTITTNLFVNPIKLTRLDPAICPGGTFLVGIHSYTSAGIYSDTLSAVSGCDSIITTNLKVNPVRLTSNNTEICEGDLFVVGTSTYTSSGSYTDLLKTVFGCDSLVTTNLTVNPVQQTNQKPSICEGETFIVGTHAYASPGNYIDVFKTSLGCDSTVSTILTVNPLPVISLGEDQLLCQGDSIILNPGIDFARYEWSDGSIFSKLKVTSPGDYSVTVYNEWCSAMDEITISECGSELWFPNAFSPDNDGINERFKPVILGTLNSYQITIFNRWGQQIYSSTNFDEGWDGNFGGTPCQNGLYVYTVSYSIGREPSIKQNVKKGTVTLLR